MVSESEPTRRDAEAMTEKQTALEEMFMFDMICGHQPGTMLRNVVGFLLDPKPVLDALAKLDAPRV